MLFLYVAAPALIAYALSVVVGSNGFAFFCFLVAAGSGLVAMDNLLHALLGAGVSVLAYLLAAYQITRKKRKERELESQETQQWAWASKLDSKLHADDQS